MDVDVIMKDVEKAIEEIEKNRSGQNETKR
jgi:hypothetical protein